MSCFKGFLKSYHLLLSCNLTVMLTLDRKLSQEPEQEQEPEPEPEPEVSNVPEIINIVPCEASTSGIGGFLPRDDCLRPTNSRQPELCLKRSRSKNNFENAKNSKNNF